MIPHTQSFSRLKNEVQNVMNFAIVVSYAVPCLKYTLKKMPMEQPPLFKPDHFDSRPIKTEKVLHDTEVYKETLSRHIVLSSFSYFEAYFHDVLQEILDFHGKDLLMGVSTLTTAMKDTDDPTIEKARKKLSEYPKKSNLDKYKNNQAKLVKSGQLMPSSLLAQYGYNLLTELIEKDYIPASRIPELSKSILQLKLDEQETEHLHGYRGIRNKIAHGRITEGSLFVKKAIEMNNFFRNLALKIDRHVIKHFLIVEV